MIELIVVIGAIMVILGLLLPSLGKSRKAAENIVGLAGIRSNATLIQAYCAENAGVFPIAMQLPWGCSQFWAMPLRVAGFIAREEDTWIGSGDESKRVPCSMSAAAAMSPQQMVRGQTLPMNSVRSVPITMARVAFPSHKGLLNIAGSRMNPPQQPWCCGHQIVAPVAFFDGSAGEYAWQDFLEDGVLQIQDNVGIPVYSTWGGVLGRDRFR